MSSRTHHTQSDKENAERARKRPAAKTRAPTRDPRRNPALQDANAGTSSCDDNDLRVRELEAALAASQAEVAALREHPPAQQETQPAASGPRIRRPKNASKVTMGELRQSLGMPKARWNALRTAIRFALAAARLDLTENWKAQEKDRLMAARNVVREDYPEMQRFVGDWGFDRIAQDTFSGSKSYRKCADNPSTYRGRTTAARRAARRQPHHSPARSSSSSHHSPPASPVAGPSRVGGRSTPPSPCLPPTARRYGHGRQLPGLDNGDDDNEEDEDDLTDLEQSAAGDEEESNGAIDFDDAVQRSGKGKKRAAEDDVAENTGSAKRRRSK